MSVTMALRVGMIVGLALITAAHPTGSRGSRATAEEMDSGSGEDFLDDSGSGSGSEPTSEPNTSELDSGSGSGDDGADGPPTAPFVTPEPPVGIPAGSGLESNDIDAAETVGIVFGVLVLGVGFAAVVYMLSRKNNNDSRETAMRTNPVFSSVRVTTNATTAAGAAFLPGKHTVLKETNC